MNFARAVSLLAGAYVVLAVTASILALIPWRVPVPEVGLLLVLYLGLSRRGSAPAHAILALGIGYLCDLSAGAPKGLHALTLCIAILFARAASSRLMVSSTPHLIVVASVAAVGHSVLLLAFSASMYSESPLGALRVIPGVAAATAVSAPLFFWLWRKIDRRMAPDPSRLRLSS